MGHFQELCRKEFLLPGMTGYAWLVLLLVGIVNELVQRSNNVRAQSLWQIPMNLLKASPLGKLPFVGQFLEAMDTPQPPAIDAKPVASTPLPPPEPPKAA